MRSFARPLVRIAACALAAAALPLTAPAALAQHGPRDPQAEQFVETGASRVLGILNNRGEGLQAKEQSFRTLIDELVDVPRVTRFVLGKYARSITPEQYQRFSAVFRNYAEGVYQRRIDEYHGEKITVTGSTIRKPGDVIVSTTLGGGHMSSPTVLQWRVLGSGNTWKIVDVQVSGVWLAITEQQDFVSTIDNAGGNINVLIAQLAADKDGQIHHKG